MMKSLSIEFELVDTNILVRAYMPEHPDYESAQMLLSTMLRGERAGVVAQQNLLEFYSTVTNHKKMTPVMSPKLANEVIAQLLHSRLQVLTPTEETVAEFLKLQNQLAVGRRSQAIYDLYLVATMRCHGISAILTENVKDFRRIPGILAINPFKAGAR